MAGRQVVLQSLQHPPASNVRKEDVQGDGARHVFAGEGKGGSAERSGDSFEPFGPRRIQQEARKAQIVFHNQEHSISRLNHVPIIADFIGQGGDGRLLNRR